MGSRSTGEATILLALPDAPLTDDVAVAQGPRYRSISFRLAPRARPRATWPVLARMNCAACASISSLRIRSLPRAPGPYFRMFIGFIVGHEFYGGIIFCRQVLLRPARTGGGKAARRFPLRGR